MSKPFEIAMAPSRRAAPDCDACAGTGQVRIPTTGVYDLIAECDCVAEPAADVEAEHLRTWEQVFG